MKKATIPGYKFKYLFERNGRYVFRRIIPSHLRNLSGKKTEFKESLTTSDPSIAIIRYPEINEYYEEIIDQMRSGIPYHEVNKPSVEQLRSLAKSVGIEYHSAEDLTKKDDLSELVSRIAKWDKVGQPTGTQFGAIFGGVPDPIGLENALTFFEEHIRDELIGLDERAKAKKLNPKRLAIRELIKFLDGDIDIRKLTAKLANGFRSHLLDRIEDGEIKGATANKQLGHIRQILNVNIKHRHLDFINPFVGLSIKSKTSSRVAFTVEFIRSKWLTDWPKKFHGLNDECQMLLLAMLDTGCGQKELCGLDPEKDIVLEYDIPHIIIQPNHHRMLKNSHRERKIPLIGYSLAAMKIQSSGFPSYRRPNGPDNASANLMKFLRNHGLLESAEHSVYSLRHTFKDRMLACKFPEELQKQIMGHSDSSMSARYGSGYTLEQAHEYMKKLEF